jgi:hypothetical protein
VLAVAYVADALFLGFLTPTNVRLQFVWIVTDTALAAGLVVGVFGLGARVFGWWRERSAQSASTHGLPESTSVSAH